MDRRAFLKDIAAGGLAAGAAGRLIAKAPAAPDLAFVQGESPAAITKGAIAALGGMAKFVAKGDVVMIKPNIGWDRTPEMAACTNPEVIRALIELSLAAGAKKVVVMDNTTNQAQRCYVRSGIQAAAKEAGAEVPFVNVRRIKKMAVKGEWLKEWDIIQDFIEADKLINVPIAKHHSLCRVTMGMKNWLGAIGDPRNQLHQKLDEAVVDLHGFFKPTLTVLDAWRILVRNGPQGGRPSDTKLMKTVVAGRDGIAVDALGATFFDIAPADLPALKMAAQRGLGRIDLEKMTIEKRTV
ncbi:MAG: DUF362 domain-containing protein [Acidobacteriota bacterium]|nr:DUF362 domain-containing protein [Acidobacteriota bacterium]